MNKTNIFSFIGNRDLLNSWHTSFKQIGGKISDASFNEAEDAYFVGTLTAKQLADFSQTFLTEETDIKSFSTYSKTSCISFKFTSSQSVDCDCTNGYWLVCGEWCACYTCKGKGYYYPVAGRIIIDKTV